MRLLILILSYLIFNQSIEVCVHEPNSDPIEEQIASNMSDVESCDNISDNKKHCCSSVTSDKDSKDHGKKHKHCNSDLCKCISCVKVFLTDARVYIVLEEKNTILKGDINQSISIHSFDFNLRLIHPPRV